MTRLRIKTADGKLERITVPDDSTLRELKEVIAKTRLCDTSTTQIRLSLNNKVLSRRDLVPCAVYKFNPTSLDLVLGYCLFQCRWSLKAQDTTLCGQLASAVGTLCGSWLPGRVLIHQSAELLNLSQQILFVSLPQTLWGLFQPRKQ